ncbi:hypothetical protein TNIN_433061 [Trichonephila inaurata madagascariensis]|uniref:Uncharacterized protein n=1 Tax=Trichonephila inaurata madagascariensis TaxID=2747483 RepID=A0A8X6YMR6_9ARAC|nr:hypothetical protein TNIN_433061 [Trichonephila inaurata madagascariensis]
MRAARVVHGGKESISLTAKAMVTSISCSSKRRLRSSRDRCSSPNIPNIFSRGHEKAKELMTIQGEKEPFDTKMLPEKPRSDVARNHQILPLHDEMREKLDDRKKQFDTDIGELTFLVLAE